MGFALVDIQGLIVGAQRPAYVWRSAVASHFGIGDGGLGQELACSSRRLDSRMRIVAHKRLRCGKRVTLCVRRRCSRARVGDRGPFVGGRDFDASPRVARDLGQRFIEAGVARVRWHYGWG